MCWWHGGSIGGHGGGQDGHGEHEGEQGELQGHESKRSKHGLKHVFWLHPHDEPQLPQKLEHALLHGHLHRSTQEPIR